MLFDGENDTFEVGGYRFGEGDYPGGRNKQFFGYRGDTSPILRNFPKGFAEGMTVRTWWGDKTKLKMETFLGRSRIYGAFPELDNVFCQVIILQLKMHATGKIFGKICLKAIRDTVFPICGLRSQEEKGARHKGKEELQFFVWGGGDWTSNRRRNFQNIEQEGGGKTSPRKKTLTKLLVLHTEII